MNGTIHALTPVEKYITLEVPLFEINEELENIKTKVIHNSQNYQEIDYIYFEDAYGHLTGVTSIKKLLQSHNQVTLNQHINTHLIHCYPHTNLERAAGIAAKHGLSHLPVIDHNGKLLGVVTAEVLLKAVGALYENKTYQHGGIIERDKIYDLVLNGSLLRVTWVRLPWLIVGLLGGILSAKVVGGYEEVLAQSVTLALFMPAVVYMSAAVGIQTETLYIRTIAIKEHVNNLHYFVRDTIVTFLLGSIIGGLTSGLVYTWKKDWEVALVLGLTMLCNITLASIIGLLIPFIFGKLDKDPAIVSGPLSTIIQDMLSLVVYFTIAYLILLK